nr:ribonuclease H-like domain-containing protein [Tanacetum cinerariifolium]
MDQQNPTPAKIPILDTEKFKQWQFRIQQYIQHEHYALWEVIKFGYSYEFPKDNVTTGSASDGTGKKKGRTVALTTDDMQKRKNDVKARTNLLLALPNEHQLCFSKHKTAQELWDAILKIFGCNEATKKTKKNLLKQQYGNFKAEGSETLDQTFNRLQVIISHLEFLDIEIEHDDLNQKFLTTKHSSGNEEVNTASVSTASTNVSTDINQIDENDMEEMDIKWNMALLSMRADRFWKKTGKKIIIQGTDVAGFDKSKVECFNCHKMGHFARECMDPRSQDRGRKDNYRQGSKIEEQAPKALMAIDGNMIYHYKLWLSQVEGRLAEFKNQEVKYYEKIRILEFKVESRANIESLTKELKLIKKEKEGLDSKLAGFQTASKDLDNLLERLPEFVDDTVTDYNRPSPAVESITDDLQNRNPSVTKTGASPKPFIKFVKAADRHTENKTDKGETVKKPAVKYAELYRKPSKSSSIRGSQRNWNNLKSQQLDQVPRIIILTGGSSQNNIDDKGYWDSGCSRHMTCNISYLSDYEPFDRGYVSFGQGGCKITGKGTIKTDKLEFENVYFVKDLKYNLFSVSQICDNKNNVMFTDSECIVLGRDFKLIDDTYVLLRTPRQHNMYSIDLNNIVPHKDLTYLVAKASADECMLWHRRL